MGGALSQDPHPNGEWAQLGTTRHRPYLEGVGVGIPSPALCPMRGLALRALHGVPINEPTHHNHHDEYEDTQGVTITPAVNQMSLDDIGL